MLVISQRPSQLIPSRGGGAGFQHGNVRRTQNIPSIIAGVCLCWERNQDVGVSSKGSSLGSWMSPFRKERNQQTQLCWITPPPHPCPFEPECSSGEECYCPGTDEDRWIMKMLNCYFSTSRNICKRAFFLISFLTSLKSLFIITGADGNKSDWTCFYKLGVSKAPCYCTEREKAWTEPILEA